MGTASKEMTTKPYVWLNGALLPEEAARVSLFDRGYLYGDGLFETMRAYNSKLFRLRQHFDRIAAGASEIGIPLPLAFHQLKHVATELLQANGLADAYLRLTISRGVGLGPLPAADLSPTISLIARPLRLPSPQEYETGWKGILAVSSLAPGAQLSQLKSLSYLDKLLAKMQAKAAGAQEAILTNARGEITEASTSNIFIIKGQQLLTPPISAGLLPGITRAVILELAAQLSLTINETAIKPADVFVADECFLTNSIMEIMPLTRLADRAIGTGRPGAMTLTIQQAYRETVLSE